MLLLVASALIGLIACGGGEEKPVVSALAPAPVEASFAGSESCRECHGEEHLRWSDSHHAHAWTAPALEDPRDRTLDAKHPVVGWVGWDPLRQPLVDVGEGRVQAWARAWDPVEQEWFYVFDEERTEGERGHWTGPSMTWNSQCAPCHVTGHELGYDVQKNGYLTRASEHGVGCEACHGMGAVHVAGGELPLPDPPMDVCASCHSRRADLSPSPQVAPEFLARYAPALVDHSDTFWPDGQIRDENFEYNAFLTSRMYQEGVRCRDCHDPHSGALTRQGDALCLECHATHEGWQPHDRHEGAVACVDCHMPQTTYMQRHPRHDHGFRIPDPELAMELGTPDTCTRACHADQTPGWAAAAMQQWGVDPSARRDRARARAVATARQGGPQGYLGALEMLRTDPHPTWQAIGAGLLGPWSGNPDVSSALKAAAGSPEPLIRFAAVGALPRGVDSEEVLAASREGPLAVRVQAARAVAGAPVAPRRLWPLRDYLKEHRDQPDTSLEYAAWLSLTDGPAALDEYRRAVSRWPRDPAVIHAFAVELSRQGNTRASVSVLRRGTSLVPEDPELWDALGRALATNGDVQAGMDALLEAVELDSTRSRTWFNLAVLRQQLGDLTGALEAYRRAAETSTWDADPLWGAASVEQQRGRLGEARALLQQALARDPTHPGALELQRYLQEL